MSLTLWLQVAEPDASTGSPAHQHLQQGPSPSLPHVAARRTLEKSPYLRFSSPRPPSRKSPPRVVERVTGQMRSLPGQRGRLCAGVVTSCFLFPSVRGEGEVL